MKTNKSLKPNNPVVVLPDERDRIAAFYQLLIQIDSRVNICSVEEKKAKAVKKVKVKDSHDSGSYKFPVPSFAFEIWASTIANMMYYLTCYGVLKPG